MNKYTLERKLNWLINEVLEANRLLNNELKFKEIIKIKDIVLNDLLKVIYDDGNDEIDELLNNLK